MIVKMLKLRLFGLKSQKDEVLSSIFATRCVQLKPTSFEGTTNDFNEREFASHNQMCERLSNAIGTIEMALASKNKSYKPKKINLTPNELRIDATKESIDILLDEIEKTIDNINSISQEETSILTKINNLSPYLSLKKPFTCYQNTKHTNIFLGRFPLSNLGALDEFVSTHNLSTYTVLSEENRLILALSHRSEASVLSRKLNELGFVKCTFDFDITANEKLKEYNNLLLEIKTKRKELLDKLCEFENVLIDLKISHDAFALKRYKAEAEKSISSTKRAFVLEGYLPISDREKVEDALKDKNVEYSFLTPTKSETPPTKTKNNKIVSQFEVITNTYSPPNYKEFDPNAFITFFFSLFFGFIMADIGYGIVLFALGRIIAKNSQKEGTAKLFKVFSIGGVVSIVFGILFGSFFGLTHADVALIPKMVMPNPTTEVIPLLAICLGAGGVQIALSYALKGILCFKRKLYLDGIFSGFCWVVFFVGLMSVAIYILTNALVMLVLGAILCVASVLVSVVGQAIINHGIEKFSAPFMSVYGIINIFSDILSYARLFGLMLSGNIIAGIVDDLSFGLLNSPQTFVFGVLVLAVGHTFNIAIGVLGAYIHVSRLQYVEFFSRFYEGEGELFSPFGSQFKYVNII